MAPRAHVLLRMGSATPGCPCSPALDLTPQLITILVVRPPSTTYFPSNAVGFPPFTVPLLHQDSSSSSPLALLPASRPSQHLTAFVRILVSALPLELHNPLNQPLTPWLLVHSTLLRKRRGPRL